MKYLHVNRLDKKLMFSQNTRNGVSGDQENALNPLKPQPPPPPPSFPTPSSSPPSALAWLIPRLWKSILILHTQKAGQSVSQAP